MKKIHIFALLCTLLLTACAAPDASVPQPTTPAESAAPGPVLPDMPESSLFSIPFVPPQSGGFNPLTDTQGLNAAFVPLVYESLFKRDTQFRPVPLLCRAYEFSDMTLTLTLKDGVRLHDGGELTAEDAAFSLRLAKAQSPLYAARLAAFSDIRAVGRYTLTITVSETNVRLLTLLDVPIIKANTSAAADAVGSGRYLMQQSDELHVLAPFPDWHGGGEKVPAVPHLLLIEIPNLDALIYNLSAGNLDGLLADPLNGQNIAFHADADRYSIETPSLFFLSCNTAREPLHNADVRRALGRLIDRTALAAGVFGGALSPGAGLFPRSAALFDADSLEKTAGYDAAAGRSLLQAAGFRPDANGVLRDAMGQPLTLSLLVNGESRSKKNAAEAIAAQLSAAGVTVDVSALPFSDYQKAAAAGRFDLLLAEASLAPDFDVSFLLSANGALNFSKFADERVPALLSTFAQTVFTEAALPGAPLVEFVAETAPILPLGTKKTVLLVRKAKNLINIRPTISDAFDNIWDWEKR